MTAYGSFDRPAALRRLADDPFDLLVVGGGITGAGVALDAASRGLRTALVERDDFASGTSSKSSKLVHGGLRYLQQGDVRLVYEALAERQRLRRNAPHLVKILPFLIPIFAGKDGVVPRPVAALGSAMWMYDLTGGARIGKIHKRLSKAEALAHMPTLPEPRLASAYLYYDAQTDDARLTLTIARTAALDFGVAVANRAKVVGVRKGPGGRVEGVDVEADGATFAVRAAAVVNAGGVWADDVRALDEAAHPDSIRPAKGIHITVPWDKVRNDIAVVIPVPKDKRSVFVVPWGELTYVGTTDTDYDGPLDDPECTPDDIAYLLRALNFSVTSGVTETDIVGTWAGLRPLVKSATSGRTADLSRRHRVAVSDSGVVTITGGKLTTYREMAADTVDAVVDALAGSPRVAPEPHEADGSPRRIGLRRPPRRAPAPRRPLRRRGPDDPRHDRARPRAGRAARRGTPLPPRRSDLRGALRDGPDRRRRVVAAQQRRPAARRDASAAAAVDVADLIGAELGWSSDQRAASVAEYRAIATHEREAAGLAERTFQGA